MQSLINPLSETRHNLMCFPLMNKYECFTYCCRMIKLVISLRSITMIIVSLSLITSSTCVIMLYSVLQASAFLGLPSPTANNNNFLTYQDSALGIKIMGLEDEGTYF